MSMLCVERREAAGRVAQQSLIEGKSAESVNLGAHSSASEIRDFLYHTRVCSHRTQGGKVGRTRKESFEEGPKAHGVFRKTTRCFELQNGVVARAWQ